MRCRFFLKPFLLFLTLLVVSPRAVVAAPPDVIDLEERLFKTCQPLDKWQVEIGFPDFSNVDLVLWRSGGWWRQEWRTKDEKGKKSLAVAAIGQAQKATQRVPEGQRIPLPLLQYWCPFPAWWQRFHIETGARFYQFLGERPVLAIGGVEKQYDKPQLWLDNDTFAPLFLRLPDFDVEWSNMIKVGNFWLPTHAQIKFNDGHILKMVLVWRSVNVSQTPDLFKDNAFSALTTDPSGTVNFPGPIRSFFRNFPAVD